MAKGSDLDRVSAIVLREMRAPLAVLLVIYTLGIMVMVMIPGIDGQPMGLFHAFYFMTYTATTTGFGEIPQEFSDLQRMWATVCLYLSVIGWIYAIGTIIRVVQNPHFTLAIAQARFARAVRRINAPFFIICGFGDTGSLLARGLSDRGMNAVIIDHDQERIKALDMRDYTVPMPGLQGDASVPRNLQDAGLLDDNCKGVVLLTGDEDVNMKIAVMVRLLNPEARVVCRSISRTHDEELTALGSVTIIDPFETWAHELGLALYQPPLHTLDEWLVGAHGVSLEQLISHPQGTWILCGYGQLGKWLYRSLAERGVEIIVIDPDLDEDSVGSPIRGLATKGNLEKARVDEAVGVIAATNSDADNLAILLTARNLNPTLHLIVRQNSHENELAFNAASADLIMQPSLVTARRLLLQLISPLVDDWLRYLEDHPDELSATVLPGLQRKVSSHPALWTLSVTIDQAPALLEYLENDSVAIGDIVRDARNRDTDLPCMPLVVEHQGKRTYLPTNTFDIRQGDEILFCSQRGVQQQILKNLANIYTLTYLVTGESPPRGYAMNWLMRQRSA